MSSGLALSFLMLLIRDSRASSLTLSLFDLFWCILPGDRARGSGLGQLDYTRRVHDLARLGSAELTDESCRWLRGQASKETAAERSEVRHQSRSDHGGSSGICVLHGERN